MTIQDNSALAQEIDLQAELEKSYDSAMNADNEETNIIENDTVDGANESEGDTGEENTDQGSDDGDEPGDTQPLKPHDRWSAELKAKFATLPREAQEILLSRESEQEKAFTQKTQEIAEQRKSYEAVEQIMAPRRQAHAAQGLATDSAAIGHLFELSDFANSDPAGFIKHFAQHHRIDLGKLNPTPAATDQADDEYIDPTVAKLQQQVEEVTKTLTQQQQAQAQARTQKVRDEIAGFSNEKDEAGNSKYPHFESVRQHMASLIQGGTAKNLKHAYEMAIWANPEVREKIQAEKKTAEEAERIKKTKEAAAKAEKAKGVQFKSKGSNQGGVPKSDSWESTLEKTYDKVVGAA